MPPDLDIDRSKNLNGSMSPYSQHLLISSGQKDWTSKIEDERDTASWGRFTADIKEILGRRSQFHDPYNNILISTSSFTPEDQHETSLPGSAVTQTSEQQADTKIDALLFPTFKHVKSLSPYVTQTPHSQLETFARAFLLPERLHPIYNDISESERRAKTRNSSLVHNLPISVDDIQTATILICSHAQRDGRCGILGPLLQNEFLSYINTRHILGGREEFVAQGQKFMSNDKDDKEAEPSPSTINVGTISHIGGHKWAGNVIAYIPPNKRTLDGDQHPLAGKGIWYGRVEPRHVQGIVEETVLRGRVIRDLFRGGIGEDGSVLRL